MYQCPNRGTSRLLLSDLKALSLAPCSFLRYRAAGTEPGGKNVMASSPDTHSADAQARLVAISGPLTGEVLALTAGGARIGRDSSNDICLADLALSRAHCAIGTTGGTWRICDSQSSNGTFVNGVQVTDSQLNDHDRITLGGSVFLFVLNAHPATIPPLLERPIEPATRLAIDETIYLRPAAELRTTARAEHDLRALLLISTTLNRITTEGELYGQVLELLAGSLPAEQVAFVMAADGDTRIVDARQLAGAPSVPVSQTVVTEALEQRAGLLTCGGASNGLPHADSVSAALESILCVPMVVRNSALGALYLTTSRANAFDPDHLQFATAVANVAAIVLDNLRHVSWLHRERARLQHDLEGDQSLVGRSAAMQPSTAHGWRTRRMSPGSRRCG
jgi:adenylate cyclase